MSLVDGFCFAARTLHGCACVQSVCAPRSPTRSPVRTSLRGRAYCVLPPSPALALLPDVPSRPVLTFDCPRNTIRSPTTTPGRIVASRAGIDNEKTLLTPATRNDLLRNNAERLFDL